LLFPSWKWQTPKVLIVVPALRQEIGRHFWLPKLYSSSPFVFSKKIKTKKNDTHRHSRHTVCDGVSGVTEEGGHPGVSVCLVSGTGSAVREAEGVFSVFFTEQPSARRVVAAVAKEICQSARYIV
jgi:hypothetical protein